MALHDELVGERVPQRVRVDAPVDAGALGVELHHPADVGAAQRAPQTVARDRAEELALRGDPELGARVQPPLDRRHRSRVDRDRPAPVPLAVKDGDGATAVVDVLRFERQRLRDAEPRTPHHRDERPIA